MHLSAQEMLFYVFGTALIGSAFAVITARNAVHSALFLVLAFVSSACLWVLLQAEFLGIALVLVYVGAVMVLFLFVVMMLDINTDSLRHNFWRHFPLAGLVGALIALEMTLVLRGGFDLGVAKALGRVLYTDYGYAFEIAAVVLLVAIVAAIALTLRRRKDTRKQDPAAQVRARREERVQLVSMPSEKE